MTDAIDKVLDELVYNKEFRRHFFVEPEKIDQLVRDTSDLQFLYERSCDLFKVDEVAALKLMFHIFFQTPPGSACIMSSMPSAFTWTTA